MKHYDFLDIFKNKIKQRYKSHKNINAIIYNNDIFEEPNAVIECECNTINDMIFNDELKNEILKISNVDKNKVNNINLHPEIVSETIKNNIDEIGIFDAVQLANKYCEVYLRLVCKNDKYKNNESRIVPSIIMKNLSKL